MEIVDTSYHQLDFMGTKVNIQNVLSTKQIRVWLNQFTSEIFYLNISLIQEK